MVANVWPLVCVHPIVLPETIDPRKRAATTLDGAREGFRSCVRGPMVLQRRALRKRFPAAFEIAREALLRSPRRHCRPRMLWSARGCVTAW